MITVVVFCPSQLHALLFYNKMKLIKLSLITFLGFFRVSSVCNFTQHQRPFKVFQTRFQVGRLILLLLLRLQHSYFGTILLFSSRIQANVAHKSILEINTPYVYFHETKLTLYHLLILYVLDSLLVTWIVHWAHTSRQSHIFPSI